jgi:hypothetical protein
MNLTLSTIKIAIIGYMIAMIQDILKSIFRIKPIPKNNTKNNKIEIIKTTMLICMEIPPLHITK